MSDPHPQLVSASAPNVTRGRLLIITLLGVAIRLVMLLLAGDLEPLADESNYLYLAALLNRTSVYSDGAMYLWPPGYAFFLSVFLHFFGLGGVFAAKLCQVLLSGVIGLMIMLIARRLFSLRAAYLAGLIWCLYLPLIGFTHYLWPETLYLVSFLPGFYALLLWWQVADRNSVSNALLVAAGALVGLSLFFKEVSLWWCAVAGLLIFYRDFKHSITAALSRSTLFLLAVAIVIAPWTLRNYEVYRRFVPIGATLGQNAIFGLNASYVNFDYLPQRREEIAKSNETIRHWLIDPPAAAWQPSAAANIIDRSAENFERGVRYFRDNPGYAVRTRIKKIADWVTPLSFFVRHYGMSRYDGFIWKTGVRRLLICGALILPMFVLLGAFGAFFVFMGKTNDSILLGCTVLYFAAASSMIVSMSRFRVCIEPLLIVLAAAWWSGSLRVHWQGRRIAACVAGLLLLAGLWAINAAEVWTMVDFVW